MSCPPTPHKLSPVRARHLLAMMLLVFVLFLPLVPLPGVPMGMVVASDSYQSSEWHLSRVGARVAWAQGADGHGVSILVIDTGVDPQETNRAMAANVGPSLAVNPLHSQVSVSCKANIPGEYAGFCTKEVLIPNPSAHVDTVGHGSFVLCEIVCNGTFHGYMGVAPKARGAMAKVFISGSADTRDVATAIRWGATRHFQIESLSLGSSTFDPLTAAAVQFALSKGVIIVAAAGNDGSFTSTYPSSLPGVIRVAATDRWDGHATYSDTGTDVTIAAPGDWVMGIAPNHPTVINCSGLCTWPGTSMATPLVAGGLADLISVGLTHQQAVAALLKGARYWHGMKQVQYGAGIMDLTHSLQYAHYMGWLT